MRSLVVVLAAVGLCSAALAGPILVSAERVDVTPTALGGERQTPIYANVTTASGYYFPAGGGIEVADDLHMISAGSMVQFVFGYYDPVGADTSATVSFYTNDPADSTLPPTGLITSYNVTGLPGAGAWLLTVPVSAQALPQDVWMGVTFQTGNPGLLMYNPPTVGSSHDIFAMLGGLYWFGGNPVANFAMEVDIPEPASLLLMAFGLFLRRR
jgi:hypothetical protein